MRGGTTFTIIVIAVLIAATSAQADRGSGDQGLARACERATSDRPCQHLGAIQDTVVGPGETRTYSNGTRTVEGDIHVATGGTLVLSNVTFRFGNASAGIRADPGATLHIFDALLEPRAGDAGVGYVLDLQPGSSLILNDSVVRGGHGVKLATSDADVRGNSFETIPLALHLLGVELTIAYNQFLDNEVAVNQTGGVTTLDHNLFDGGTWCVRDWLADPTISNNVFRGCHFGIWHERSASMFYGNDMANEAFPPGTGIAVIDTNSPIIEGNTISHYGNGILVINATAYIRNNTITHNVDDGVRVEHNTQPMDITGNEIAFNGGDGIHLLGTHDVNVSGNDIHDNGGDGVRVEGGTGTELQANDASANGGNGFSFAGADLEGSDLEAVGNGLHGILVTGGASVDLLRANASGNAADGFHVATTGEVAGVFLAEARAIANVGNGLVGTTGTFANGGWWEANGGAGVQNVEPDFTLSTICSYWGSANGPAALTHENGDGDEVVGNVDWSPHRPAPELTGCFVAIDTVG